MAGKLKLKSLGKGYTTRSAQTKAAIAIRYFGDRVFLRDAAGRLSRELNASNLDEFLSKSTKEDGALFEVLIVDDESGLDLGCNPR